MVSAEGNWRAGFVLLSRRTFLARLVLESSSPSPVGASALRLMDDESAIVVVFVFVVVVMVVVLLELPASGQNLWPN